MAIDLMEIVDIANMPDVNGTNIDPQATDRANLRKAIQALAEAEQKLALLSEAKARAQEERYALSPQLSDLEARLERAKQDERARIAEAFTNRSLSRSPVPDAQAAVDKVRAESTRLSEIEDTIDSELEITHRRIDRCRAAVNAALAGVICGSDAFHQLLAAQKLAWERLRGIRRALYVIQRDLHGYLPHEFANWDSVMSLDPDPAIRGVPTDERPSTIWQDVMTRLSKDADAPLPDEI